MVDPSFPASGAIAGPPDLGVPQPPPPPPPYKLYDRSSIVIATVLGSPLAGGWLMALNYRRLGDRSTFRTCLILSFLGTAGLMALGFLLPERIPSAPFAIAGIFAMAGIAKLQAPQLDQHRVRGGQLASRWKAAGVGLLFLVLISLIAVGVVLLSGPPLFSKVTFPGGEEVFYEEQATKADAQKLGEFLQKAGFFDGLRPKTVVLSKTASGSSVSFVVSENAGRDPAIFDGFNQLRLQLQASGFDQVVIFRLCDQDLKLLRQIP